MITPMSSLFVRTLREDPADAEVPSHKLLVRAGFIRRIAPGVYSWLPLGLKVLRNIERIVREEMDGIGAQEIELPALLPRDAYEVTGRWIEYGDALFRLKDRKKGDYLLGPTHEEIFTETVKGEYSSYKDFPVTLYQIQTKYRDEERPRAGILRGREFVMCDSYSFDMKDEGLEASYQKHRAAYQRMFNRLGLDYAICAATSGAMGGSASEEFLAVSPVGEDTFVTSTNSDYAANVEAVVTPAPTVDENAIDSIEPAITLESPNCTTIATLVDWANSNETVSQRFDSEITAQDTLKCVVVKTREPGEEDFSYAIIAIPGDREVDMKRLEASLEPKEVVLAEQEDFDEHDFLPKGYVGPVGMAEHDVKVLVDPRVVAGTRWITGAGVDGHHSVDVTVGRDFTPDGAIEAAEVKEGDPAPDGTGTLLLKQGIEIGHIFQLGRKYTNAFELDVLDENGKRSRPTMGSYGVGVSRLVAVVAEQYHDDKGLKWPVSVAPFPVHLVVANKDAEAAEAASTLAEDLSSRGLDILFDDRPKVSPGVKFKDSELLGMPYVVVLGRAFKEGKVEVRDRLADSVETVPVDDAAEHIAGLVKN
ncbi:proline--tRNA ligase [Corynebacterium parakroppenstedtii]|uniref:proline--tRNA ligase n=1 Tax=Corynebacterium parakroppenstedtii TaxID=2828363 RepID=UPI001C8F7C8C|nr:proline--tRNA ligase [Corynebacterium parakroppenstedtii]MBY0794672.1 proline--tRNA ligase [Corynebacterium parakroppenstedtii]